ncbi:MAG: hypothetical protein KYX68_06680 [Flavobacterium sp.]|nr:hypothetical protein [Flavobacterium sp.]
MKSNSFLPVFSYIFHPIFITLYGTLYFFLVAPHTAPERLQYLILIQVSILTLLMPLALYFLFISLGIVTSFTEASIKERKIPVLIQSFLFFALLYIMRENNTIPELFYFYTGGFFSAVLAFIAILLKYKASLHMIGITSLACFVYAVAVYHQLPYLNMVAFAIVCMGLVASSRLYMKSHTMPELFVGFLIGLLPQYFIWKDLVL